MNRTDRNHFFNAPALEVKHGTSNRVERIEVDGALFARRVLSPQRTGANDRDTEFRIWRAAFREGLAPELVFYDSDAGVCVSRWLEADSNTPWKLILNTLAAFHELNISSVPNTRPINELLGLYYTETQMRERAEKIAQLKSCLDESSLDLALCHNDIGVQNTLIHNGVAYLIDFEYASMGHPWFDIATLWIDHHTEITPEALATEYGAIRNIGISVKEMDCVRAAIELSIELGIAWAQQHEPSWTVRFRAARLHLNG